MRTPALGRFWRKKLKKIIFIFYLFLLSFICFATEFRLTNVSKGYDGDGEYYCLVPKDSIVKISDFFIHDERNNSSIDFSYGIYVIYQDEEILVNLEYLIPTETQDLFDSEILTHKLKENGRYWADNTVCEILKSNTRDSYYKIHKKEIDNYNSKRGIYDEMEWYEGVPFNGEHIENLFLILDDGRKYTYYYFIKKIEKKTNGYIVSCELTDSRIEDSDYENNLLERLKDKKNIILNLVRDGDYLYFYSEDNQLLYTYVLVDKAFTEQYENLILNNKYDSTKVTWPLHADGSCDYDGSKKTTAAQIAKATPSTNVAQNKTLLVSENLKLRSGEATSTQVLAVMQAGTKVKILELGKAETIDGISSNWVKIEVQAGAKDRDGKPIKAGTIGWCYGGYLK